MDKLILKKIAKEWCRGILLANGTDSLMDLEQDGLLSVEESSYIVEECHRIAERITKEPYEANLENIVKKYYEIE